MTIYSVNNRLSDFQLFLFLAAIPITFFILFIALLTEYPSFDILALLSSIFLAYFIIPLSCSTNRIYIDQSGLSLAESFGRRKKLTWDQISLIKVTIDRSKKNLQIVTVKSQQGQKVQERRTSPITILLNPIPMILG